MDILLRLQKRAFTEQNKDPDIVDSAREIERLRKALQVYAHEEYWTMEAIDSYSGEIAMFDWPGDLQDEPYEIAQKALNND